MGAWIETYIRQEGYVFVGRSHPTWVRGLKQRLKIKSILNLQTHHTWVRGLKLPMIGEKIRASVVAPYVGAWIETTQ